MKKSTVIWGVVTFIFFIIALILPFVFPNNKIDDIITSLVFISVGLLLFFNPYFLVLIQPHPQDIFTLLIPKLKRFSENHKEISMEISIIYLRVFGLLFTGAGAYFLLSTWPFFDAPYLKLFPSLKRLTLYYSLFVPAGMISYFYSENMGKGVLNIALQLTTEEKAVKIYNISVKMLKIFSILIMVGGPIWGIIALRRIAGL